MEYIRVLLVLSSGNDEKIFGDDALRGNTRFHPEHVG